MMRAPWFIQTPTGTLIWNETSQDAHSSHLMISHRAYLHIAAFYDITTAKANTRKTINKCYIVQCESNSNASYFALHEMKALFIHNRFILRVGLDSELESNHWAWGVITYWMDGISILEGMILGAGTLQKSRGCKVASLPAAFTSAFNKARGAFWIITRWSRRYLLD